MIKIKKILLLCAAVLVVVIVAVVWYMSGVYTDCRMSNESFEEIINCQPENYLDTGVLYADEEKVVFYCLNGIFVYNCNKDKIEQMIDVEKLNCAINENKQNMGTTIHSDGEKIAFINYGDEKEKFDNYSVYLSTGLAKKEIEPRLNDSVSGSVQVSWVAEMDCWRSSMCRYVGDEMIYMELDKGDKIAQLKLVAADKNSDGRRDFYPLGEK